MRILSNMHLGEVLIFVWVTVLIDLIVYFSPTNSKSMIVYITFGYYTTVK